MYSLNRAQLVGNVTRDPEMRYTPNGQAVCSFSVATNRRWRDKDGNNQEQTEFHNVVAWGKVAEIIAQYVKKGHKIYIEGRLQTRTWEGQDGGKRNRTEIVMEDFVFLTPKGVSGTESSPNLGEDIKEFSPSIEKEENKSKEKAEPKKVTKEKEEPSDEGEINLDEIPF
ncbi:MAG: single-stranded DNA-binding protein [Patescibacteria group bacterium]|nr:single-stranded DNA-binding protein [Patescibacteria group bacterium]